MNVLLNLLEETVSEEPIIDYVKVLLIPVAVYIAGRVVERLLGALYARLSSELTFKEGTQADMAMLTIRTKSEVFLDALDIHLEDRALNILNQVRKVLEIKGKERIQFSPLDRIRFECMLQPNGDKKLFTAAYIGANIAYLDENLSVNFRSAREFMQKTRVTIETSRKTYERHMFKRGC